MAASEKTTNYGLPIYKEDDTTTWADYNQSMQLIDAQMKRNADAAASGGDIPADVEQRLDALEENDISLANEIKNLGRYIGTNTADITSLKTASSEQGAEISSLSGSVSALSSTAADHETRIHAVELSAAENHTDILAAEQRIAVNENEIAIFNQEISDNQTNIAALQVDNTKNKQDIASLQTWQNDALPGVKVLKTALTMHLDKIEYYPNSDASSPVTISPTSTITNTVLRGIALVFNGNYCQLKGEYIAAFPLSPQTTTGYGFKLTFTSDTLMEYSLASYCGLTISIVNESGNYIRHYKVPAYIYSSAISNIIMVTSLVSYSQTYSQYGRFTITI